MLQQTIHILRIKYALPLMHLIVIDQNFDLHYSDRQYPDRLCNENVQCMYDYVCACYSTFMCMNVDLCIQGTISILA